MQRFCGGWCWLFQMEGSLPGKARRVDLSMVVCKEGKEEDGLTSVVHVDPISVFSLMWILVSPTSANKKPHSFRGFVQYRTENLPCCWTATFSKTVPVLEPADSGPRTGTMF